MQNTETIILMVIGLLFIESCSVPVEDVEVDCTISDLTIEVTKLVYSDCGLNNGEVTVEATGGKPPYRFSLDGGALQTSAIFTSVIPGFRDFSVVDANSCSNSVRTFMSSKDPFHVVTYTSPSGCNDDKGSITIVPLGGVPPYKYQLGENNDNYQSENIWEELRSGQYGVWVEDANRCFFGVYVYVPTGVSYAASVAPIIQANCATSACHDGTQALDFRSFAVVRANATKIRTAVNARTMPPEETLSSQEIDLITCWVNDGAPNN